LAICRGDMDRYNSLQLWRNTGIREKESLVCFEAGIKFYGTFWIIISEVKKCLRFYKILYMNLPFYEVAVSRLVIGDASVMKTCAFLE